MKQFRKTIQFQLPEKKFKNFKLTIAGNGKGLFFFKKTLYYFKNSFENIGKSSN